MRRKTYFQGSALIFGTVGFFHLMRLVFGWQAQIGEFDVPLWVSIVVLPIAVFLAYRGYKLSK